MRGMTFGMVASTIVMSAVFLFAGCDGTSAPADVELGGRAELALMGVPADGTCVQVTAAGYRTITRSFSAAAGSSAVFELSGLPLGQVTFTASASGGACPAPAGTVATWISDAPFTATIAVDPPALVTLNLVRNGNANVTIGFDDGAQAGSDGGAGTTGAAGGTAGAAGAAGGFDGSTFMQIPGIVGGSVAKGFENWFTLESFTLGASTPSSATAGGGAGAAKTSWTATAALRFQAGVPDLYGAATKGTVEKTVTLATRSGGASPAVIWKATLSNVVISGIANGAPTSGDVVPELTVTFVFSKLDLEFDPRNPDGTAGGATLESFDLARGTGPAAPNLPMQFIVGGSGTGLATATAFHAPSETTPTSTVGTGAGVGKATFTDASLELPIDASALGFLAQEVAGRLTQTASVQLATRASDGTAATLGTYGFQNVVIHAMTFTGATATMSFGASAFKWSQGATTVTFP